MNRATGRHDPRAFAADTVSDCFPVLDAQLLQVCDPSLGTTPLFPVTRPEAATNPLVEVAKEAVNRDDPEVTYPALEISSKFCQPMLDRDATIATRDLASSVFELLQVLQASFPRFVASPQLPSSSTFDCLVTFGILSSKQFPVSYRGLVPEGTAPHEFTPMPGVPPTRDGNLRAPIVRRPKQAVEI